MPFLPCTGPGTNHQPEILAEEGRASPTGGRKGAPESPSTVVVLQPDGHAISCAVKMADVPQHRDHSSEDGSGALGVSIRELPKFHDSPLAVAPFNESRAEGKCGQ